MREDSFIVSSTKGFACLSPSAGVQMSYPYNVVDESFLYNAQTGGPSVAPVVDQSLATKALNLVNNYLLVPLDLLSISAIYGSFTTKTTKLLLMVDPLPVVHEPTQLFFFPVVAGIEIVSAIVGLVNYLNLSNKNAEKTLKLSANLLVTAIVATSILMGAVALFATAAVAPILGLVSAILFAAVHTINISLAGFFSVYHFTHMMSAPEGSALQAAHQKALLPNLIKLGVSSACMVVSIVFFLLALSNPALTIPVGILGIGALAVSFLSIVGFSLYASHSAKKAQEKLDDKIKSATPVPVPASSSVPNKQENNQQAQTAQVNKEKIGNKNLHSNTVKSMFFQRSRAAGDSHDRYYQRNIVGLLLTEKRSGYEKFQTSFDALIEHKIDVLSKEKSNANGLFKLEAKKRSAKINALIDLRDVVYKKDGYTQEEVVAIAKKYKSQGVFQSFNRNKGDVEVIFDAAMVFASKGTNKEQKSAGPKN